jgi:hypothetical protein
MVKVEWTTLIAQISKADKLKKAAMTGLRGVTRGKSVAVIPVISL